MTCSQSGYERILVATDFSESATAAFRQGVWLARQTGATLVLTHTLPDRLRMDQTHALRAQLEMLYGEGQLMPREIREAAEVRLKQMVVDHGAADLNVRFLVLPGQPFVELTHAAQTEDIDLVLAGTRGLSAWKEFLVGSTARRLIRKCPTSVWIAKAEHLEPPKVVLAATDFSEVSHQAALEGWKIAQRASAKFHLLHTIDHLTDYLAAGREDHLSRFPVGPPLRSEVNDGAQRLLEQFVTSLGADPEQVQLHLSWGTAWLEISRLAQRLQCDLVALGTVGRSGIPGVLLGNTAERVLSTCESSILTVKPDGFVSPLLPPGIDRNSEEP